MKQECFTVNREGWSKDVLCHTAKRSKPVSGGGGGLANKTDQIYAEEGACIFTSAAWGKNKNFFQEVNTDKFNVHTNAANHEDNNNC